MMYCCLMHVHVKLVGYKNVITQSNSVNVYYLLS